ncbi:MAG: hypothetical protein JXD19_02280 [Deltaproteobacteria bacterium]|nr:hypothetical protein [Deltaproteobacteria bacterium]
MIVSAQEALWREMIEDSLEKKGKESTIKNVPQVATQLIERKGVVAQFKKVGDGVLRESMCADGGKCNAQM